MTSSAIDENMREHISNCPCCLQLLHSAASILSAKTWCLQLNLKPREELEGTKNFGNGVKNRLPHTSNGGLSFGLVICLDPF